METVPGYTGIARALLERAGARVGDRIRIVQRDGRVFEGILMPRYALSAKPIIVIKLDNGYNIGVRVDEHTEITVVKTREAILREAAAGAPAVVPLLEEQPPLEKRPRVMIIGTGGTIASKIEYETGAVKPAMSARDLVEAVPEIGFIAEVSAEVLMNILSENMRPEYWERIVDAVAKSIAEGFEGIVVAHGTDTMAYTASALAFAFRGLPVPIAFVGAQRSSDRPSSDASFNLISAVLVAARAPFAEVTVVMHGETGDTYALAHRATKVRKMHTSRRDAFQSINARPLARVYPFERRIELVSEPLQRRGEQELRVMNGFERKVALVKYYPGMDSEIIDFLVDRGYRGIVLEGTGLGHVGEWLVDSIRRAVENEIVVVMTSQTLFGRVNMNVYATGRKLLAAGVVPGDDMLPETAFVKLSWVLAHSSSFEEAKRLMRENLAGEINPRHTVDLYPRWPH
ncbi:Glu-tRNA(Gln) amidotransferase subunit GatD [Hyperthermus butylicus]|uniref:Glutamyl-tRNA(Gln) amidotransferase subunit D n=1 Tax=Hyperthermus butylicus (strain DSM 5456 / JCM 9403 / PLM1-5) TaxID=415426 RepID=A2BLB5_HYPBU|nr:Glu-tRNA(Gln) amidotransferase subunit GatD [Hyperthermus butylicus]ABM80776.1 glutamyl-tRNA(Gln) amidotransferase subunit D [Hyperthermus butylicus DSM 5456]